MRQGYWHNLVMFARLCSIWAVFLLAAQAGSTETIAQEPVRQVPPPVKLLPGEVMPPVYELKDKDGKLHSVPGYTLEEFRRLFELQQGLERDRQPPRFTISSFTLVGSASGRLAELDATAKVELRDSGWVRVPLRLKGAVLRAPAIFEPADGALVEVDPDGDGYVVWLRGEAGEVRLIKLKLSSAIKLSAEESTLTLNLPRAAIVRFELRVPLESASARVSEGFTLEAGEALERETILRGVGSAGTWELSWRSADSPIASVAPILDASDGYQTVRLGGRTITSEAKLKLRSFGGEFDRFPVRLPRGSFFAGIRPAGVTMTPLDLNDPAGPLYEATLPKKTVGPLEIELTAVQSYNPRVASELTDLAGFEVVGAVRQWGQIDVAVEGNWRVIWGEMDSVRAVEESPRDEIAAVFEYSAQPYSLPARLVPLESRVRVEGDYQLLVGSEEAQLRANLKYTIRGHKVRYLAIDLTGWEVDSLGPANLVDVDQAALDPANPFTIPLLQPTGGEIEIQLEAHCRLASGAVEVELDLPRPTADVVAPAAVAVLPADNIELFWQPDQSVGLSALASRPLMQSLPERQQDPLYFRTEVPTAKFVAALTVHEQAITSAAFTQLDVDEREIRVDQRLTLQVAYQPADHLILLVPGSLRPERLTVQLDGQRLTPTPVRERPVGETEEVIPLRVPLPSPRVGRCELHVNYVVRHDRPATSSAISVEVPLVMPEGQLLSNELQVTPRSGVLVSYDDGPWSDDTRGRRPGPTGSLALAARRPLSEVALELKSNETKSAAATTITQAWIHSRLADGRRQDRAIFRLTSNEASLRMSLPQGSDARSFVVELDGRSVRPEPDRQGDWTIAIPPGGRNDHLLDLKYNFAERQPLGQLSLSAPQVKSATLVERVFWQLSMPSTEHLLQAPEHFTRELHWVRQGLLWQREPTLSQQELEAWLGVASVSDTPRISGESLAEFNDREQLRTGLANTYLFSTISLDEPLAARTMSRARLVLLASLPVLGVGLLLVYFPKLRHPLAILALAIVLAIGGLTDPDAALLLVQGALLGVVLAAVAALMARAGAPLPIRPMPVQGSSRAIERHATQVYQRKPSAGGSQAKVSTPLVPAASPEGDA